MYRVKKEVSSFYWFIGFLESLIRNRIHVATCSVIAAWTWSHLAGSHLLAIDLFVIPLIMLCIYQWNRLYDLGEDAINSPKSAYLTFRNKRWIKCFCLTGVIFGWTLSFVTGPIQAVFILSSVILLGAFYSMPFFSISGKRLKNLTHVKNHTSAVGWTLLVVIYPPVHSSSYLFTEHWVAAMVMFTSVWMVELIWDIRDQKGDALSGVNTIPVLQGVDSTRRWILMINGCAVLILLAVIVSGVISAVWLFILLNNLLIYIWITRNVQILSKRDESHLLVAMQTLLLVSLGLLVVHLT